MGNCQARDGGSVVVVEHPGGKVEKVLTGHSHSHGHGRGRPSSSVTHAHHLMARFPGYFVAMVMPSSSSSSSSSSSASSSSSSSSSSSGPPQLTLLPSGAPLRNGNCYRLVTFEEAFKNFTQICAGERSLCQSPVISAITTKISRGTGRRKRSNFPVHLHFPIPSQ